MSGGKSLDSYTFPALDELSIVNFLALNVIDGDGSEIS